MFTTACTPASLAACTKFAVAEQQHARGDRVAEIRGANTGQGRADGAEIQQVAFDDLGAERGERLGASVYAVDEGADPVPCFEQDLDRGCAGVAGGSGNEEHLVR